MQITADPIRRYRKLVLSTAGIVAVVVPIVFGFANAPQSWAQSQSQGTAAAAPNYQYDVASIKPSTTSGGGSLRPGFTPDGYSARITTIRRLMIAAYGVETFMIFGGPSWLGTERYDVEARMDPSVSDALLKLNPADRKLAQQKMLQALLADRFKLTVHWETKQMDEYTLVIAKNGPKISVAKPGDTYANGLKGPDGQPIGAGQVRVGRNGEIIYQGVPISTLVRLLAGIAEGPVIDKTSLTGTYDFTFQWPPPNQTTPLDPSGADFFDTIQDQLGLKLQQGKGPVEVIVIDHVERPSGN